MGKLTGSYNLLRINPKISKEWHPTKNGALTPKDITSGSNKKVWWICDNGHEWKAIVKSRSNGSGCPFCAGQRTTRKNCLETIMPALAIEWHPTKNGDLTPKDIRSQSHEKVWWVCSQGHEWQAKIYSRTAGKGCPYCSGRRVCDDNCLQATNPLLFKEWHPNKNGNLSPKDVTPKSIKKVWWFCKKGHEWQAKIRNRSINSACPYCTGRKASEDNCLQTVNPELAKEWHPTKNGQLTPIDVLPRSREKVWWTCSRRHEWKTSIYIRTRGSGCRHCAAIRSSIRNKEYLAKLKLSREHSI